MANQDFFKEEVVLWPLDHSLSLLHGMQRIKHILMHNIPISVYTQEPNL